MLHGGIERGTITILSGPSGVGKTTLGIQFSTQAAKRGERSLVYLFEEPSTTLIERCEKINIPIHSMIKAKKLSLLYIEPLRYSADEFANLVRYEVEQENATTVLIDNISSYRLSLRGEDLVSHLHGLCKYLQNMGVTVILINELESVTGAFRITEHGISYLADNIIIMRYMEKLLRDRTEIGTCIGVMKKRLSDFDKSVRKFDVTETGIKVSKPLPIVHGLLSGIPKWIEEPGEGENEQCLNQ